MSATQASPDADGLTYEVEDRASSLDVAVSTLLVNEDPAVVLMALRLSIHHLMKEHPDALAKVERWERERAGA